MKTETLKIEVRPETAERYRNASEQDRLKMSMLMEFAIEDFLDSPHDVRATMSELSKEAKEKGLTLEKLDEILNE